MTGMYEVDLSSCGPLRLVVEARTARWLTGVFGVVVALVLAAIAWAWLCRIDVVVAAPGRLRPTTTPVAVTATVDAGRSAGVGTRVAEVRVRAGERVRAGDVLAVLDTRALALELGELRGDVAGRQAELDLLIALGEQQDARTQAERDRSLAEIDQAARTHVRDDRSRRIDLRRTASALARLREREDEATRLVAGGHASREELDTLRRERQGLEADARKLELGQATPVEVLRRSLAVLERSAEVERLDLQVRVQSLRQSLDQTRAALAKAELALAEATLRAPIDGVVTDSQVEVGTAIASGTTAFVIAPEDGYLFEAIVDSADAGHLRTGMPARVAIDTFDAQRYGTIDGTVVYLAADSVAAESQGLRYVVRVAVPSDVIGRGEHLAPLRLGLGGRLRVVVGHERILSLLLSDLEDRFDVEWSP